jgi:vitamin B12 transporter
MKKILILLALASVTQTVTAQTDEQLIITGQYSPVENQQLTSSVSVITRADIDNSQAQSLSELLKKIPGVWVEDQGGAGGLSTISLRGAESNYTLVLLDGVEVNDPTNTRGGAFNLNAINVESIHRIEIVRGAQSAIYGSDALAGVIHIITKTTGKTTLNASVGSDDYISTSLSTSGKLNNIGYAFSLQTKNAGEPVPGSTAKNTEFSSRLDWQQENHTLKFNYRYFDGERTSFPEQSGGPEFAEGRDLDKSEYKDQSAGIGWAMQLNDFWQSRLQTNWYQREEQIDSPGIAPYFELPPNGSVINFERTTASWVNTLGDKDSLWVNLGAEHKREEGTNLGYAVSREVFPLDFSMTREINSAFINANAFLVKNWLVQASWRHDHPDSYSAKNSRQIGTRYEINEHVSLFANWGEGFKLPSFFALGHPMTGNELLVPETVKSGDAGIVFSGEKLSSRISYFDHHYHNLIDFDSDPDVFRNVNRSRVETSGVESEINWQVQPNLKLRLHASYTDIDMMSSDNHLLGRPQFTYGTSAYYDLNDNWQFNLNFLHVGERFAASLYTGSTVEQVLDTYNRFDASIQWQINKLTQVGLSLENLTDENYYTDIGFPAAGVSAKLNLNVNF